MDSGLSASFVASPRNDKSHGVDPPLAQQSKVSQLELLSNAGHLMPYDALLDEAGRH
jgi:hypothetical protein